MTNEFLENRLRVLAANERKVTAEILQLILLGEKRRLYLAKSYPSSFDWLTKEFGYSHSAAYRRIQASRLVARVPDCAASIEAGKLSLSVAAEIQNSLSKEEKRRGKAVETEKVQLIVRKLEGKSDDQARAFLGKLYPGSG